MGERTRRQRQQQTPGRYVWLLGHGAPMVGEVQSRLSSQFTVRVPKYDPSIFFVFYKDKGDSWKPATSEEFSHGVKKEIPDNGQL